MEECLRDMLLNITKKSIKNKKERLYVSKLLDSQSVYYDSYIDYLLFNDQLSFEVRLKFIKAIVFDLIELLYNYFSEDEFKDLINMINRFFDDTKEKLVN